MGRRLKAISVIGATVAVCVFLATGTEPPHPSPSFEKAFAAYDLQRLMNEVSVATGEVQDFVVTEDRETAGASAIYSKDELREVDIGRTYFDAIGRGEKWDAVFMLAHEEGHFVLGHVGHDSVGEGARQMAADSFAGFACYRLGATLDQTTHWLRNEPLIERYSPGRLRRVWAAAYGWRAAHLTKSRFVLNLARMPGQLF
jgi:hypothetical protein